MISLGTLGKVFGQMRFGTSEEGVLMTSVWVDLIGLVVGMMIM
jgi:hypothetical protein